MLQQPFTVSILYYKICCPSVIDVLYTHNQSHFAKRGPMIFALQKHLPTFLEFSITRGLNHVFLPPSYSPLRKRVDKCFISCKWVNDVLFVHVTIWVNKCVTCVEKSTDINQTNQKCGDEFDDSCLFFLLLSWFPKLTVCQWTI